MRYRSLREEEDFNSAVENEIICNDKYCPYFIDHHCSPSFPTCEGSYCEEAWDNFCDENDKEYEM